jgi:uncharacterized membrane protein YbhN (UPF0104 family)
MQKRLRPLISIVLLAAALLAGAYYLADHQQLLRQLVHTPLVVSLTVFGLYIAMFGVLMLILAASLRICHLSLTGRENGLLNAHSLFVNFFVPGQGGPAYRGAYLYKRHRLKIKSYIFVTLLYYLMYAVISIFLLFVSSRPWWQTLLAALIAFGIGMATVRRYSQKKKFDMQALDLRPVNVLYLFLATALQAVVQVMIYAVELHNVDLHITLWQTITYTGAANMALFVALTPGAIGIRESFLILSERLHHISSAHIVLANLIDRSVYIIFLLCLVMLVLIRQLTSKRQTTGDKMLTSEEDLLLPAKSAKERGIS